MGKDKTAKMDSATRRALESEWMKDHLEGESQAQLEQEAEDRYYEYE